MGEVERTAGRSGAGNGGTATGSPGGWPVMPEDAAYDGEARQRRALGRERRTVAVRRLDRGDRWRNARLASGVRASAFKEAMWYWIRDGRWGARSMI